MSADTELLQYTYQGARMGQVAIQQLLPRAENGDFSRHLHTQLAEYSGVMHETYDLLRDRGEAVRDIPPLQKASSQVSVRLNTMRDRSPTKMAEVMLQGSMMGVIESTKRIRQYEPYADGQALGAARKLLATEESNIEQLKDFLH